MVLAVWTSHDDAFRQYDCHHASEAVGYETLRATLLGTGL